MYLTKQALIAYSIGNVKDKVLCDVFPMDACHILLKALAFDKSVIDYGKSKAYSFKLIRGMDTIRLG